MYLSSLRLFREATQLITVGTVIRIAGIKPRCTEMQVMAANIVRLGRPNISVATDKVQGTIGIAAVARGGAARPPFIPRGNATEDRSRG